MAAKGSVMTRVMQNSGDGHRCQLHETGALAPAWCFVTWTLRRNWFYTLFYEVPSLCLAAHQLYTLSYSVVEALLV